MPEDHVVICPDHRHTFMLDMDYDRVFCVMCGLVPLGPVQDFWRDFMWPHIPRKENRNAPDYE